MGLRPAQLKLPTEHLILNLEGVIVNLDYDSAVAQAKPTRSRFDPLQGGLFGAFLIFQNGVFLSVIVNEFKFAYLVRLSVLHNPTPISQLATVAVSQHLIRSFCKRLVEKPGPKTRVAFLEGVDNLTIANVRGGLKMNKLHFGARSFRDLRNFFLSLARPCGRRGGPSRMWE
jgi:hypothetical protein